MLSDVELDQLKQGCQAVPRTANRYVASKLVPVLLDTVVDYQMHNTTVLRAMEHFERERSSELSDMNSLMACLASYPDDKEGNIQLAIHLWGYRLWTRAAQLRHLVEYFLDQGVRSIDDLRTWAERTTFEDFRGQIHGLGHAVYQWLVMRLGRKTVKPDVHILRFVSSAIGRTVSELEVVHGLEQVGADLGIPANELDWSIWEYQRRGSA